MTYIDFNTEENEIVLGEIIFTGHKLISTDSITKFLEVLIWLLLTYYCYHKLFKKLNFSPLGIHTFQMAVWEKNISKEH